MFHGIHLANKAVAEVFNTSLSTLTGKYHADFHHYESELQNMLQDDREVMTKGETKFIPEESYTNAQGNLRFLQTTKVPFHLPGDKTPAVLGVAIDITERKRSEEALQAAHEQFKGIIEFLPDATFVVDRAGKVIAWNRAIEEMTGVRKEKMIGMGDYAYAVPFYGEPHSTFRG
jgi:PAS domain S-box-containing protein